MKLSYDLVLTRAAKRDVENIARWTKLNFGPNQATLYRSSLAKLAFHIAVDPFRIGSAPYDADAPSLRLMHIRFVFPKGRHLMIYRVTGDVIEVLRVLHDNMDVAAIARDLR